MSFPAKAGTQLPADVLGASAGVSAAGFHPLHGTRTRARNNVLLPFLHDCRNQPKDLETLCESLALSPLGERVARERVFTSRRGSGKGVPTRIARPAVRGFHINSGPFQERRRSGCRTSTPVGYNNYMSMSTGNLDRGRSFILMTGANALSQEAIGCLIVSGSEDDSTSAASLRYARMWV